MQHLELLVVLIYYLLITKENTVADIKLTIIIPDKYVTQVVAMLEFLSEKSLAVRAGGSHLRLIKSFFFAKKEKGESQISHAQKLIREFIITCLRLVEMDKCVKAKEIIINQADAIKEKPVVSEMVNIEEVI